MQKGFSMLLIMIGAFLTACAGNALAEERPSRTLVVYFSLPEEVDTTGVDAIAGASIVVREGEKLGNVQFAAQIIARETGADLFQLEAVNPYPTDHDPLVDQAAEEQDNAVRPELTAWPDLTPYDTIFLGYPNWWGDLPMPLYTFLEQTDMGAKHVIPFTVHGGSGLSDTVRTISRLQPDASVWESALSISRSVVASSEEDIVDWVESLGLRSATTAPASGQTVAAAEVDPAVSQTLYLWEEDNMPATTDAQIAARSADGPGFRPNVETFPVPQGTPVKGAVLINAGGAFQFRSDETEGRAVAEALRQLGYQCFVVHYRLRPSTQEEGALDLARAVRFVRAHAREYGLDEQNIAVVGFSAGGILAGEMLLHFDGQTTGSALDSTYIPDALDEVSADAAACGMIYAFYGRLSVSNNDVETLKGGQLPPTFYAYGTRDPFYAQFIENAAAVRQAAVHVEEHVFDGQPHGFGVGNAQADWIPLFDAFLTDVFAYRQGE